MRRGICWFSACVALAVPFLVFWRMTLFHFYVRGAFLQDSGQLAYLLWHSDMLLTQSASAGAGSYLAVHMVPLFWLISAVSWMLPASMAGFFALFLGASHALLAFAVFWLLVSAYRTPPWIAALLGIAFACSGLAFAIARYPHFETLIPAFFLLFATAQRLGHSKLAVSFFVLGLATREDAGLHYAILLLLVAAWSGWKGTAWRYAVVALVYVVVVAVLQRLCFPGTSAFERIYLGNPPLAHLTPWSVGTRLLNMLLNRPYVLWPALGACVWAVRKRDPAVVLGYVACLPWLLLNTLAAGPMAGMLVSYYAFPFLIAMAWPLYVGAGWRGFAVLLALSFVPAQVPHNPGRLFLPASVLNGPSAETRDAIERAVSAIVAARPELGVLVADNSVAALAPNGFSRREILFGDSSDETTPPDTVVFFIDGYDAQKLENAALPRHYAMPGTPIRLISRLQLESVPAFAGLIAPE